MHRWASTILVALWLGLTAAPARAEPTAALVARADDLTVHHVACRLGNRDSCETFAGIVQAIGAADLRQALADNTLACDRGEAKGCWALAVLYGAGLANPGPGAGAVGASGQGASAAEGDDARAVALYQKACDGGYAKACRDLGHIYMLGDQAPRDKARAVSLYIAACKGGSAQGCADWGDLLEWGSDDIPQNKKESVRLWTTACAMGEARACSKLARKYEHGEFVARDAARALALYEQACAGGDASGCFALGYDSAQGEGVPRDETKAATLYDKACALGDGMGCIELGHRYQAGLGVAADPARAIALFEKSCTSFPRACRDAAAGYRDGQGVARDTARALALFHRACHLQDAESCTAELALQRPAGAPPAPEGKPAVFVGQGFTTADYPKAAIRQGEHGLSVVHFTIGVDGGVRDCVATGPSDLLNAQTCRLVLARFRYLPARDAAGRAVEQPKTERVMWVLPNRR